MSQNVPKQKITEIHHFHFIRKPARTLSGAGAELDIRRSAAVWEISLISAILISVCSWFISVELCKKYCGLTSSANVASTSNLLYLTYRRKTGSNQLCDGGIGYGGKFKFNGWKKHTFFKSFKLSGVSKLSLSLLYSSEDEEEKSGKGGWRGLNGGALTLIKPFLYSLPRKQQQCQKNTKREKREELGWKKYVRLQVCREIYVNSLHKRTGLKVESGVKIEERGKKRRSRAQQEAISRAEMLPPEGQRF